MTSDLQTLCAIVRGDSAIMMPGGEARDRLLSEAHAHRVQRLVAWRTKEMDHELRAEAMLDELEVRELCRVLAGLRSRGIVPIVLKGAALAQTHYEESWLRPRLDTDLLIASSECQAVVAALEDLGYTRPPFISGQLVMYQMPFERLGVTGHVHALDVHWRLANPQMFASLPDYEALSSRAITVNVRGEEMTTLNPVDTLLLACVHRAAHHDLSDELLWLYDMHLVAQRFTAIEWDQFVAIASRCQVCALCVSGLQAAQRCFQTRVPPEMFARLTDRGQVEPSALYLRKNLTRLERLLADLWPLNSRERLRLLLEHIVPPAGYVTQKYGGRAGALLPLLYLRRLASGVAREISWPLPDTRSRSSSSSSDDRG